MLELPEAVTLAKQLNDAVAGKIIARVVAARSPHGFAFYTGDPILYDAKLSGRTVEKVAAYGGITELQAEGTLLTVNDGVNARYLEPGAARPPKHQLLVDFTDGSAIVCTIQMYGGMHCFEDGTNDNFYYAVAKEKPSPLTGAFDARYFSALLNDETKKISAKAFLATEQRIPGLGNGVLQDILWQARVHPKRKMNTLTDTEFAFLFDTVKQVLRGMAELGGRDTEKDLYGHAGGYTTVMSKKNSAMICPSCGGAVKRMAYLGGNVYVCETCQQ